MITSIMKQSKVILKLTAIPLLWLTVWQLTAIAVGQELVIPTPTATFLSLIKFAQTSEFWLSVLFSMLRIITGYFLGITIGVIGGILTSRFAAFKSVISPILHLIRAVPVASFIILAFFWLQSSDLPIFISFLMVLPMIWSNVETGLNNIDMKYIEMAKIYKIKPIKVFFKIKLHFILPSFVSTAMTALGFAWKSSIAAEVICRTTSSLGGMLQTAKSNLETPEVFALTAVVAVLSLLLEIVIKHGLRRFVDDKY